MKFGSPPALFVRGVVRRCGADGCGTLLILPFEFLLWRHRPDQPYKSGRPPLFELSLQVRRDLAHDPDLQVRGSALM
jgi:hypothetical protein